MGEIVEAVVLILFGLGLAVWFYLAKGDLSKAEKDRLLDPDEEPMLWTPPETQSPNKAKDHDDET